jgi:hypothetical protein
LWQRPRQGSSRSSARRSSVARAIEGTADPKEKLKLQQLLTSFTTGEEGAAGTSNDKDRISQFNRLAGSVGFDASLQSENDEATEDEEPFSQTDPPASQVLAEASLKTNRPPAASHSIANHKSNMCAALNELKGSAANTPSAVFDRAN